MSFSRSPRACALRGSDPPPFCRRVVLGHGAHQGGEKTTGDQEGEQPGEKPLPNMYSTTINLFPSATRTDILLQQQDNEPSSVPGAGRGRARGAGVSRGMLPPRLCDSYLPASDLCQQPNRRRAQGRARRILVCGTGLQGSGRPWGSCWGLGNGRGTAQGWWARPGRRAWARGTWGKGGRAAGPARPSQTWIF